jgi:hypothetical protein
MTHRQLYPRKRDPDSLNRKLGGSQSGRFGGEKNKRRKERKRKEEKEKERII